MQIIGGAQVALETGPQLLQCWAILAWPVKSQKRRKCTALDQ